LAFGRNAIGQERALMVETSQRVSLTLTPILKLIIAVVGLLLLQVLVSALPMIREIPTPSNLPLPVVEIVQIIIATVILALLVNFAFEIEDNLELAFPTFTQGGITARWLILLMAVLIAYWSYHALAETFLGSQAWIYSLVFLGLALVPLINLVFHSYQNIDTLIGVAVAGIHTLSVRKEPTLTTPPLCASCGVALSPGTKFCRGCGVPVQEATKPNSSQCSRCGTALHRSSKFCPECGTRVP
jgi:hypothetical protein